MTIRVRRIGAIAWVALTVSCSSTDTSSRADSTATQTSGARVDLTGAGATFPYPLYSRWFNDYAQRTNVRINYQSIGSGGGIRQMLEGTVDFGATDVPMTDAELSRSANRLFTFPRCSALLPSRTICHSSRTRSICRARCWQTSFLDASHDGTTRG